MTSVNTSLILFTEMTAPIRAVSRSLAARVVKSVVQGHDPDEIMLKRQPFE
jgi:hypothetical protein